MEIHVIDFNELQGKKRKETMSLLHKACEKWGFFQIENHGIDKKLMEKVKQLVNKHYEENLKQSFYESNVTKILNNKDNTNDIDWESSFFNCHRPKSNINEITHLCEDLCKTIEEYIAQLLKLAENLSDLMCENLELDEGYIQKAFSAEKGPSMGRKVAKYPEFPHPELVRGLREHTDAGGIILLLQDDQVPGLAFLRDGEWVKILPSRNNTIFVNKGDQLEVLSNGRYQSALHHVMADKNGSRLSIATFYNPAPEAIISPAPKLFYPSYYTFQDYLKLYGTTKFSDKGHWFESMKKVANGNHNLL